MNALVAIGEEDSVGFPPRKFGTTSLAAACSLPISGSLGLGFHSLASSGTVGVNSCTLPEGTFLVYVLQLKLTVLSCGHRTFLRNLHS